MDEKVYLNIPYNEKDKIKALGAKWDPERKKWYYTESTENQKKFAKWTVFTYLTRIAELSELGDEEKILPKNYGKIKVIDENTVLADYLNPPAEIEKRERDEMILFPFGCNKSQFQAVKNALENKCSVIEGPPGTGKTQTILNIIANLLVAGKTIQVASNNNAAIENVLLKLDKYEMGFIVAFLGNSENKKRFIEEQNETYPAEISLWEDKEAGKAKFAKKIKSISNELDSIFEAQETLAKAKQEFSALEAEKKHFKEYVNSLEMEKIGNVRHRKIDSKRYLRQLVEYRELLEQEKRVGLFHKLKGMFQYGITDDFFYKQELFWQIIAVEALYYETRSKELEESIQQLEKRLKAVSAETEMEKLRNMSMKYLKHILYLRYGNKNKRRIFVQDDLKKNPQSVLEEYSVTLSTTFSARTSLNREVIYDYLIMDEASQIDVATGALALSGARNAVIVGDLKQLPNVVPPKEKKKAEEIFNEFCIPESYNFAKKSLLQSICELIPNVPHTLLQEHYRCHPKIIDFCNQRFYENKLVIMTEDKGEEDTLWLHNTAKGEHARKQVNQRQIDTIKTEILPELKAKNIDFKNVGIIAPYRKQVNALVEQISEEDKTEEQIELEKQLKELQEAFVGTEIEVDTVHKFQGREKDTIILTTVDDKYSAFSDDPNLLNVAISRAQKRFILVTSGNEPTKGSNMGELISYAIYHKAKRTKSKVCSIFDYLYEQYTSVRQEFLKGCKSGSRYDSERLMYELVDRILKEEYPDLTVKGPVFLRDIINRVEDSTENRAWMSDREREYIAQGAHVDLLIYSSIGRMPVLAIEVDGAAYHKEGSIQAERDKMKDRILKHYGLKPLRFPTTGSGEKETLQKELAKKRAKFGDEMKKRLGDEWR